MLLRRARVQIPASMLFGSQLLVPQVLEMSGVTGLLRSCECIDSHTYTKLKTNKVFLKSEL